MCGLVLRLARHNFKMFPDYPNWNLKRELKIWDICTGDVLRADTAFDERSDAVALSPDGNHLAAAHRRLVATPPGQKRRTLTLGCMYELNPALIWWRLAKRPAINKKGPQ